MLAVRIYEKDVHHNSLYDNVINNQNVIIFTNIYTYRVNTLSSDYVDR